MLQVTGKHRFAEVILIILAVIDLARGLLHYLAPDSGTHIIAGMDITTSSGGDVVYLAACIGALQFARGLFFIYIALKQKQMLLAAFWYILLTSVMVLFLDFIFKQPAIPVPGRFGHIAEFLVALVTICMVIYFERRGTAERNG